MKNTTIPRFLVATALCLLASNCASTSQNGGKHAAVVFVSESAPPANASAEYLGSVAASDDVGYRKCEALYGALANQARSMGGNAVFYAGGERRFIPPHTPSPLHVQGQGQSDPAPLKTHA